MRSGGGHEVCSNAAVENTSDRVRVFIDIFRRAVQSLFSVAKVGGKVIGKSLPGASKQQLSEKPQLPAFRSSRHFSSPTHFAMILSVEL